MIELTLRLRTTVNITVTRINYDELFETIALGLLNGASSVLLNRFLPGGRGLLYRQKLELSREQLNGMLDTAEEVLSYRKCYCIYKKDKSQELFRNDAV